MTIEKLISEILKYNPNEIEKVIKAYTFAEENHRGQYRKSGKPYITHPLSVTYTLATMKADADTLVAGLLHDIVEDTNVTLDEVENLFNKDVRILVDGVTKISNMNFNTKKEKNDLNTRKIINGLSEDVRIIIIKLADRLHNMNTLEYQKPEKQKEISLETMEIYVPLAYHLGAYKIKKELEDLSFYYLNNKKYNEISEAMKKMEPTNNIIIEQMSKDIKLKLNDNGITASIVPRIKHLYGIYTRLKNNNKLENIHDLIALKIIEEEIRDCYYTLGIVHSMYPYINSKLKDYMSLPKTTMYRGIHTTVFGIDNKLVQLQMCTDEINRINTNGLTEYWDINKGQARDIMQKDLKEKFQFYQSVCDLNMLYPNNSEFVESVKNEIFNQHIYVYYEGKIIEMPINSSVIDLLFKVEENNADDLDIVFINGNIAKYDQILNNNDRIVFNFKPFNSKLNFDWYNFATTTYAKNKILENINVKMKKIR